MQTAMKIITKSKNKKNKGLALWGEAITPPSQRLSQSLSFSVLPQSFCTVVKSYFQIQEFCMEAHCDNAKLFLAIEA